MRQPLLYVSEHICFQAQGGSEELDLLGSGIVHHDAVVRSAAAADLLQHLGDGTGEIQPSADGFAEVGRLFLHHSQER